MEFFQGSLTPAGAYADSTMRCIECGTYITHRQEDSIVRFTETDERGCYKCGNDLYHHTVIVDILPTSERFLDAANVKNSVWYHATDRQNWMADLLNYGHGTTPLVHVGTKEAAITILADQYIKRDDWSYFYTVKLAPTAVLAKAIFEDENMWPIRTHELEGDANTFRYVNRYEATGSISLLVDPRELIVESVKVLTPDQAEDMVRQLEVLGLALA